VASDEIAPAMEVVSYVVLHVKLLLLLVYGAYCEARNWPTLFLYKAAMTSQKPSLVNDMRHDFKRIVNFRFDPREG
jgi:hypothetical protein